MSAGFPGWPGEEVGEYADGPLADRYIDYGVRVVEQRHGVGALLSPEEVREHALAAVDCQCRLVGAALGARWVLIAAALAHGATAEQAARATSLDADELRTGLVAWARPVPPVQQHRSRPVRGAAGADRYPRSRGHPARPGRGGGPVTVRVREAPGWWAVEPTGSRGGTS